MKENTEKRIVEIEDYNIIKEMFGSFDENINIIKEELNIDIVVRENQIEIFGDNKWISIGEKLIENLIENPIILIPIIKFTIQIEIDSIKADKSQTKIFLFV